MSSQEEVLRRRMSLHIPSDAPMTAASPELQSLSSSPTMANPFYSSSWAPSLDYTSATEPIPIGDHPGMAHEPTRNANNVESQSTGEINHQMKATLTELLNTESVRSDEKYRAWIQERLMDAEQKCRRQRRRRSSNSSGEELATSIAENLDHNLPLCKTWG
jgi:hypothetical protein